MKNFLLIIALVPWLAFGQQANARSKSELGFMVGGSSYLGDLNQFNPIRNMQLAAGLVYRPELDEPRRTSFRPGTDARHILPTPPPRPLQCLS